jgi:hypothetical protein
VLSAGVVANDEAVQSTRAVGRTFAAFADHGPIRTRVLTRPPAANEAIPNWLAIDITLADEAGIDVGVGAVSAVITSPESTRIDHRAIDVGVAPFRATLSPATFITWKAVGNGLNADCVDAGVQNTGIIFLTTAVPVVGARFHAESALAGFIFRACDSAVLLRMGGSPSREDKRYRGERQRSH